MEREKRALEATLAQASGALQKAQEQIALLQQKVRTLKERLRTVEGKKLWELLEQTATQGEDGRRIYELAQKLELTDTGAQEREELRARLPKAVHDGRAMQYEDRFLRDLQGLQERERLEVVEALHRFAAHGEQYSSFKTKRRQGLDITGIPGGSFESRSNREYRFFWKQGDNGIIMFFRVGHHTEFSSSEW
ncbi:MAG: hypothetical protein HYT31_05040 [Parcubacteria group bacterium]|nr:hypothetical protein [Parcubacteria group bacterium]